jgi:zinc-ribbon domain/Yip1 domain
LPIICPKCGTSNVDGAAFCASCGTTLTPAAGTPPMAASQGPYAPSPSVSPSQKASYTIRGAFDSAIALVRNPVGFMTTNRDTPTTRNQILINYIAVLAAITFVGIFLGDSLYYGFFFGLIGLGGYAIEYGFVDALIAYILYVGAAFVIGIVIKSLATNFKSMSNEINAMKLSSYAFTPFYLASITFIIPFIGYFISFLGILYGLYILYKGLPILLATPQDQLLTFEIVMIVAFAVVFGIVYYIHLALLGVFILHGIL